MIVLVRITYNNDWFIKSNSTIYINNIDNIQIPYLNLECISDDLDLGIPR